MTEDLSTIENIVEYLVKENEKTKDKIALIRQVKGKLAYTILNPSLKIVKAPNYSFSPRIKADILEENHYYINLHKFWDGGLGLYFRKTLYNGGKYGEKKLPLIFSVINEISFFLNSHVYFPLARSIKIDTNNYYMGKNGNYYYLRGKNHSKRLINYHFNIPWNKALKIYRYFSSPADLYYYFLLMVLGGVMPVFKKDGERLALSCEIKRPFDNGIFKNPQNKVFINQIRSFFNEVFFYVGKDVNRRLFDFLINQEIPKMGKIWLYEKLMRYTRRNFEVDAEALKFFNSLCPLKKVSQLDSLNHFIYTFLCGRIYSFVDSGIISQCGHCGSFIEYKKGKKYCSLIKERRDCGKSARNIRHYKKHRDKILDYYRKEMKETRLFIKTLSTKNKQ